MDPPSAKSYFVYPSRNRPGHPQYRSDPSDRNSVVPLIDGNRTFTSMEQAVANAKESVWLAAWTFLPETKLYRTRRIRVPGDGVRFATTWGQLLLLVAKKVSVRVLVTDFDPILKPLLHRWAWGVHDLFQRKGTGKDIQVLCSRHSATVSLLGLDYIVYQELKELIGELNKLKRNVRRQRFRKMPGLWKNVIMDKNSRLKLRPTPDFLDIGVPENLDLDIYPASHHQKVLIVDGKVAFLGGFDIAPVRKDSSKHRKKSGMLWHDVHSRVEGGCVRELQIEFARRWSVEQARYQHFLRDSNRRSGRFSIKANRLEKIEMPEKPKIEKPKPAARAVTQIHRTLSRENWTTTPETRVNDIELAYQKAISQAQKFVYLENQYFRTELLADWLIERQRKVPKLQVIIVLPVAPEEGADPITLHGVALQHKTLTRIRDHFGANAGIFSLVKRAKGTKWQPARYLGSPQVFVHSKVLIVDDRFASIGSPNVNLRSFRMDSEVAIGWFEPRKVRRFRQKLWKELLGSPRNFSRWKPERYAAEWVKIAESNRKKLNPRRRQGLVVPHDIDQNPGEEWMIIPDMFASYLDIGDELPGHTDVV